jgi:hypothetical protein
VEEAIASKQALQVQQKRELEKRGSKTSNNSGQVKGTVLASVGKAA